MGNLDLVACLCEGAFEQAVLELLLENNLLIFTREQLLEEEILRCRSAKNFERDYLNKAMKQKVTVYRILDSRNEIFKVSKPYEQKLTVVNVITAPEIEMLIIHAENCYDDYTRKRLKPSEYVTQVLGLKKVKSYDFVRAYFADVNRLLFAIEQYERKTSHADTTLYTLLKK